MCCRRQTPAVDGGLWRIPDGKPRVCHNSGLRENTNLSGSYGASMLAMAEKRVYPLAKRVSRPSSASPGRVA